MEYTTAMLINGTDIFLALSLAIDACILSAIIGVQERKALKSHHHFWIPLVFGSIQLLTPAIGATIGFTLFAFLHQFDYLVSSSLLIGVGLLGARDIIRDGHKRISHTLRLHMIILLAAATSIDALAVGFTLPQISTHIPTTILLIGATTGALSAVALRYAARLSSRYEHTLELFASFVLIGLGLKILVERLFF